MEEHFYTGSLLTKLHPVSQGNLSLTFYHFKFYKILTRLHFWKPKQHNKALESHKNLTQHNKNPSYKPRIPPRTQPKLKRDQTLMVDLPRQPRTSFQAQTKSKHSFKPSKMIKNNSNIDKFKENEIF